ncbi:CD276 antigen [Osmerus eperlanus]|uniref:CD276 antigen n=1 Tax=Osmerus eperlanus TaxID=29151 RepID=UPI002E13EF5A
MTMLPLLLLPLLAGQVLAKFEVQVPEQPVVALYGVDATLDCSFAQVGPFNLSDLSVFWQLTDTKRRVHSYYGNQDQLEDQGESFANRTSLFPAQLASGNASLLLRRVGVADEGSYTCFVRVDTYRSAALLLQVAGQNMVFPPVALWVTVGLAVCLLALLIALAAVCRRKIKESCEEARAAEEAKELEEEEAKTAMTPLKS